MSGLFAQPVNRLQVFIIQHGFRGASLGVPVITPADQWWQRHQDGFGAATALQAEQGAAVEHQVELDVTAAAVQLELTLALAIRLVLAAFENRFVGLDVMIADAAHQGEGIVEAASAEIVEEQAADTARFVAMLEEEVVRS